MARMAKTEVPAFVGAVEALLHETDLLEALAAEENLLIGERPLGFASGGTEIPEEELEHWRQDRGERLREIAEVLTRWEQAHAAVMEASHTAPVDEEEQAKLWEQLRRMKIAMPIHLCNKPVGKARQFVRQARRRTLNPLFRAGAALEEQLHTLAPRAAAYEVLSNLRKGDWEVLRAMAKVRRPLPQQDIAENAGCSRSTVSRALPVLEAAGFATRGSKRGTSIVTPRGICMAERDPTM